MSKKKLIILISSITLFVVAAVVTTVLLINHFKPVDDDNTEIEETEFITLQKPLNLQIVDYSLTWNSVENASGYLVYVGKNEYEVSTTSIDLKGKVNEKDIVSVKAIGSGKYLNSIKSIELIFVKNVLYVI